MEIEFDVEDLIGELDLIEKVQIPFAANQALKQFGFKLSKQVLPNEFLESFDAPDAMASLYREPCQLLDIRQMEWS